MRLKVSFIIGLCLFSITEFSYAVSKQQLQNHVAYLASDALEGRLTGSPGEKLATDYIATLFQKMGLEPAGDHGTFFQEYSFTAGISLGKNNTFAITNRKGIKKHLQLNQDWRPLAFSDSSVFDNTELVFAGYGIVAPALDKLPAYNSYKNLNVKNKWVVVLRYLPEKISDECSRQLSPYSSLRHKAFIAKEQGAKGIIFVSGPNAKVKNELIPLSFDTSLSGSGIVAISVKDQVIKDLLQSSQITFSLKKWQDQLDLGQSAIAPVLSHIKLTGQTDIKQNTQHGRNVIAKLKVATITNPRLIIVGAHEDHLGRGELSGSRARDNELHKIHPGADDNASGVASILEAACELSQLKAQGKLKGDKDIIFAAWSGEELGVLGSSHFVKQFSKKLNNLHPKIDVAINLDMVGHLREKLVLQGTGSSADWPKLIAQMKIFYPHTLITQADPYLPTDSTSFYIHGVPTLNFFTGAYDDYHTPRDKPDTLNYEGMQQITESLVNLILAIEAKSNAIVFQDVPRTNAIPERGFKIYLGTIPDYTSQTISGVKLSGVAKNSPAEKAGLRQNDVIIKLAGKNIHDIYDYTFVLNTLHVSKPTKLIVLRDSTKVALTIVAKHRE